MSRSKYINTFNTTAEYDAYIESAYPEFPNVGYDKEAHKIKIMRTSPNSHLIYGKIDDPTLAPVFRINNNEFTSTVDTNTFYIDTLPGISGNITSFRSWTNTANIIKLSKINLDLSSITNTNEMFKGLKLLEYIDTSCFTGITVINIDQMFNGCRSLKTLDLSMFNTSMLNDMYAPFIGCLSLTSLDLSNWVFPASYAGAWGETFSGCSSLTDVYVTDITMLNKITNNLSSQGSAYVPSNNGNCTIHYNDVDYKWQNNAWTPQNV